MALDEHRPAEAADDGDAADAALGGAMRNALRSAVSRIRLQNPIVGSFPRSRVPTKAVASASDNLSFLMDVTGYIKEAKDQIADKASPHAKASKLMTWATTTWVPNLVRASILGSVTWTSYELTSDRLHQSSQSSSTAERPLVPLAFGVAAVAGTVAGSLHGSLWTASEKAIASVKNEAFPYRLRGVLLSHGTTHLAMFASYESAKTFLLNQVETDHTDIQGALCVLGAAAFSGIVGEVATHFATPFETQTFALARKEAFTTPLPTLRSMGPSAVSTMLGWIAYEFAKDTIEAN
ncbi:hypothetical protein AC1031_005112 [Aphanomyces cochlioides]|nr:hypothetical protein AC1031_005112 [Aphanomyces cochlioides]